MLSPEERKKNNFKYSRQLSYSSQNHLTESQLCCYYDCLVATTKLINRFAYSLGPVCFEGLSWSQRVGDGFAEIHDLYPLQSFHLLSQLKRSLCFHSSVFQKCILIWQRIKKEFFSLCPLLKLTVLSFSFMVLKQNLPELMIVFWCSVNFQLVSRGQLLCLSLALNALNVSIKKHLLDDFHVPDTLLRARHVALKKNGLGPGLHGLIVYGRERQQVKGYRN